MKSAASGMASSSSHERVKGTVMLVNMYLSKKDPSSMLENVRHGKFVQTYVVHSDKQGMGTDKTLWDRPSNTTGVVVASCDMDPAFQRELPRSCDVDVVVNFAANVSIEHIFVADDINNISDFHGPHTIAFFSTLKAQNKVSQD